MKKLFKKPKPEAATEQIKEVEKVEKVDYDKIKDIINTLFQSWKKELPDSQCFTCRTLMYGHKLGHADHLFCSEECLKEFRRIRDYHDPLVTKKTIKGEDVKVIK